MAESAYQSRLCAKIRELFPGCVLLKNDSGYQQGIPDWTLFWRDRYAILEIKDSQHAREEPNQDWFIEQFNEMSFAAFIYPENEAEVLNALRTAFRSRRRARVS